MAPWLFRCLKTPRATVRLRRLAIVGIACLVTACAHRPPAATPEDIHAQARVAFLAQDYARTLSLVEPQALIGAPWAQYTLGYMYYYGRGLALDRTRARGWIQLAADQGYAPAQAAIKRMHNPAPAGSDALISPSSPASPSASSGTPASPALNAPPGAADSPQPVPEPSGTAGSTVNPPPTPPPGASAPAEHAAPSAAEMPPSPAPPPTESTSPTPTPPVTDQSSLTQNTALPPRAPNPMPPLAPSSSTDEVKGDSWVAAQEAQRYTLQLIGSSDRDAVIRYIHDRNISPDAAYYTTAREGRPWYVVVYGNYPDRAAAQAALLNLPPNVHVTSPWIRQFGDIKSHLSAP